MQTPFLPETSYDGYASTRSLPREHEAWLPDFAAWYRDLASGKERMFDGDSACWLASLTVHVVLLVALGIVTAEQRLRDTSAMLVIPLVEEEAEPEIVELAFDLTVTDASLEDVGAVSLGTSKSLPRCPPVKWLICHN